MISRYFALATARIVLPSTEMEKVMVGVRWGRSGVQFRTC